MASSVCSAVRRKTFPLTHMKPPQPASGATEMIKLLPTLTIIAAIGSGVVGGVFFAFSNFVMAALARLPVPQGIAAMNSINITVITPTFMTALFGTGLLCLVLIAAAIMGWSQSGSYWLLAGAVI